MHFLKASGEDIEKKTINHLNIALTSIKTKTSRLVTSELSRLQGNVSPIKFKATP